MFRCLTDVARDLDRLRSPITLGDLGSACRAHGVKGHLVVLRKPYLGRILAGTKTIESRFSISPMPPFHCVTSGDVLILKKSGGPIVAVAEVKLAELHGPLRRPEIMLILERHRRILQLDDSFFSSIQDARYATLVQLGPSFESNPVAFERATCERGLS